MSLAVGRDFSENLSLKSLKDSYDLLAIVNCYIMNGQWCYSTSSVSSWDYGEGRGFLVIALKFFCTQLVWDRLLKKGLLILIFFSLWHPVVKTSKFCEVESQINHASSTLSPTL